MTRDETARELEQLRAEVAALRAAHNEAPSEPAAAPAAQETAALARAAERDAAEEAESKLQELGALLEAEIRDLPTVTCLIVFSLGIVMGRLMR